MCGCDRDAEHGTWVPGFGREVEVDVQRANFGGNWTLSETGLLAISYREGQESLQNWCQDTPWLVGGLG